MKALLHSLALTSLLITAFSCGKSDDDDKDSAATIYGTLKTTLLNSDVITSTNLTGATCNSNVDSGVFTGAFTAADGTKLNIKIKGFSKTSTVAYPCVQAADNKSTTVGEKFTGCAVNFTLPDGTTGVNTYSMYRELETDKPLDYKGSCTITPSYAAPKMTLALNCTNLIQTTFQSTARNPIDPNTTGSINSATSASCNIE